MAYCSHKRHAKVDYLRSLSRYLERGHGQIGFGFQYVAHKTIPFAVSVLPAPRFVLDLINIIGELQFFTELDQQIDVEARSTAVVIFSCFVLADCAPEIKKKCFKS